MYTVIEEKQEAEYITRGYRRCPHLPESILGEVSWGQVPEELRRGLIVMEVTAGAHRQSNSLPQKVTVETVDRQYMHDAGTVVCDVQEAGEHDSIVADSAGSRHVSNYHLFDSKHEAALSAKPAVLLAIQEHRDAIRRLEEFLRRYEL